MQLEIPEDVVASLQSRAVAAGYSTASEYALALLQRGEPAEADADQTQPQSSSPEEWRRRLHAFVAGQRSTNPDFDDSRESIYPDRT